MTTKGPVEMQCSPFVPKAVPSPLADRQFCARRRLLLVLVADGHKPDADNKRIAGAALRQRKPGGPAARAELSFAHVGTFHGNECEQCSANPWKMFTFMQRGRCTIVQLVGIQCSPFVPKAVPSPLADRQFCARRRLLLVLVADGHKPDADNKRIAGAALRQRKPGGPAARAELSFAHVGTSHGNGGEQD